MEKQIPEAGVTVHIFGNNAATATLIMLAGLHPDGIHDGRFRAFALSCSREGYQVIAVDLLEFRRFQITKNCIDSIAALVLALPVHFAPASLKKVGLLGISYGAGPVFLAAARETISSRIDFLVSIGGYYELRHTVEFALTGIHDHKGFYQKSRPQPWARIIFAINHLPEFSLPSTDSERLRESLMLRLNLKDREAEAAESDLSPAGRAFLKSVLEGMAPDELGEFGSLLLQQEPEMQRFSPAAVLSHLRPEMRVYLLHGRSDDLVPYVETLELEQALRLQGHHLVHGLVTDQLSHVDVSHPSSFMDFLHLIRWVRLVLRETH